MSIIETSIIASTPNSIAPEARQITFGSEIVRKLIHIGSLSIPIMYYYASRTTALEILVPVAVLSFVADMGRHYFGPIERLVNRLFSGIIRPHERQSGLLSGATYVMIAALFCVLVFPKLITITAFAILIVSDASSALIGRKFGKHKFLDKSLEGSLAFVVTAWIVILITPKAGTGLMEYAIAMIAAVIGGIAEASSARSRMDDNLSVPLSIGFVMWALYFLLGELDPAHFGALYDAMMRFS
ncbi:MAG: SEC59/DGK1/VTE5 family protein [Bacteroidota bacterium]|nr:SEC59/DGK1/VTE5 family protein [Bacteroidota bacterium]MDP4233518.1 SEC59/DGK1/VTE5 family protein [Bacteroidota bacterium]MDP4243395.1 SEC59/DGK1/VTE5 family protein [Bacteroidota bacterium]MDP4287918.1 SEC59/DGK1/VTE5 family protein [Bacteroidota bacterium]